MSLDPQALYSEAERAYLAGRYADAKAPLIAAEPMVPGHPAIPHLRAVVERRLGNLAESRSAFERAARLAPDDFQIANNYGNLLSDLGELELALSEYRRAARLAPDSVEASLNAGITLRQLGRHDEARGFLEQAGRLAPNHPGVWSARGSVEREAGNLTLAAACFDRALAAKPDHARAARARASIARTRGEASAASRYRRARELNGDDRGLIIEEAEVLAAERDPAATQMLLQQVRADPGWADGHGALARIRWEQGETQNFASELTAAIAATPGNAELWATYLGLLADSQEFEQAAAAARSAQAALPQDYRFTMAEAVYAGAAGDHAGAGRIFDLLPPDAPDCRLHEARHRIRTGELERGAALLDKERQLAPDDIRAWSLTEVLWRAMGDSRSKWLSDRPGLVGQQELPFEADELNILADHLRGLHTSEARPLGQSLRSGTQTRHRLFDRIDPELVPLREALWQAVGKYQEALPPEDREHPLLRHRNSRMKFAGSWSVRLAASGHHVSHVHPEGLLSSACYIALPTLDRDSREGWLEIGMPPEDLKLPLDPLMVVEPLPGRLMLFPSYFFHGTRSFTSGERLTVAFDVSPETGAAIRPAAP